MVLPITKLPAQVLRRSVKDIQFPLSKAMRRLLLDMLDTVKAARGVGLAAPQVGQGLNLALIYLEESGLPPFFILNPKILETSKETTVMEEGCLSMPGVFGPVERPKKITVEFYTLDGEKQTLTDDTFLARVIQHECDHLRKTLIKDKLIDITHGKELLKNYDE
jgi:peptide deformylase